MNTTITQRPDPRSVHTNDILDMQAQILVAIDRKIATIRSIAIFFCVLVVVSLAVPVGIVILAGGQ